MPKSKYLHVSLTDTRLAKLKALAIEREHTLTRLVEDWIDRLPSPKQAVNDEDKIG